MTEAADIKSIIADAIIERPFTFVVDGKPHYIYPQTLGKRYLVAELIEQLEINDELLEANPIIETLRLASTKREVACRIIAIAACKSKEDSLDYNYTTNLAELFQTLDTEDIATLLNFVLSADKSEAIIKHFKIDEDMATLQQIEHAKNSMSGASYTFGGKTIWGNTIDYLCERYGWSVDYVVWGVSWQTIQMLIHDSIKSVHLTDEERKRVYVALPGSTDGNNLTFDDIINGTWQN